MAGRWRVGFGCGLFCAGGCGVRRLSDFLCGVVYSLYGSSGRGAWLTFRKQWLRGCRGSGDDVVGKSASDDGVCWLFILVAPGCVPCLVFVWRGEFVACFGGAMHCLFGIAGVCFPLVVSNQRSSRSSFGPLSFHNLIMPSQ